MGTDDASNLVGQEEEMPEMVAISSELWEHWSMQAELDVRAAGLQHTGAVDVGIALWNKGLVAGIRWCSSQLDAVDGTPRECSACGILWPADSFSGDSVECIECAPIPV